MWLEANFDNSRLPAMQVAIQNEDNLAYSRAFGHANIANNERLTAKNVFRIASHSKTFTATAIMQLVEAGRLNLDDMVNRYLDWFVSSEDERVADITIRQLMNHTAGMIRDGSDANFWQVLREFPKESELREFVGNSRLIYDSDTQFKYSNYGYGFLGLVIAKISGMPYREYVKQNIIDKLGLQSTGPDLDDRAKDLLATGYGRELYRRDRRVFEHIDTQDLSSATGFYSNAEDVCKYFSAHFLGDTSLISDASKRQMQHGYWDAKDDGEKYGLGMIHYPKKGWTMYGHSGGFPGFITNTRFDAKRKLVVSVLINAYDSNATQICKKIINIIDTFQQDTDSIELPIDSIEKFEGRFYSTWGPTDVVVVGKRLFAINLLGWVEFDDAEELEAINDTTLRIKKAGGYSSAGEDVVYNFDIDGRVTQFNYAGHKMLQYEDALGEGWF
jgi:CubicO group peptidase (beta-lactamase class C family)